MGVIGVMGDVVVDELNAGDIDCSSKEIVVAFKWLSCGTILLDVFVRPAAITEGVAETIAEGDAEVHVVADVDAERFSIAELRRIIILLVFGNNKLLPLINSLDWPRELEPVEWW